MRRCLLLVTVLLVMAMAMPAGAVLSSEDSTTATLEGDEDPLLLEWSAVLPGFTPGHDPSSSNECKKGHVSCVEKIIREMDRRVDRAGCHHRSLFGLAYLRTTQEYLRAWSEPDFFADPAFLNHYDAVFARFYFDAVDSWDAGRVADVDPAWRVAFAAEDAREVTSGGNMLLGMSAHINNDLPFTLAAIGLVAPDGTSRKADHDKVNQFLNRVTIPLREEIVRRYDPAFGDADAPTTLDETAIMALIASWREGAWRNAERLVGASSPEHRATIESEIKTEAGLIAESLAAANAYGPLRSSAARDAHCAANR